MRTVPALYGTATTKGFEFNNMTDTEALNAGFHRFDIIVSIGKKPIRTQEDVWSVANGCTPGESVVVRVNRGNESLEFPIEPSATPHISSAAFAVFPTLFEHDMPLLPASVVDLSST